MGFDEDNPKWTDADFARAKAPEELPAELLAAFPNTVKRLGRPPGSTKQAVSLRLDREVIDKFKATGPGWQSRINEALRRVAFEFLPGTGRGTMRSMVEGPRRV